MPPALRAWPASASALPDSVPNRMVSGARRLPEGRRLAGEARWPPAPGEEAGQPGALFDGVADNTLFSAVIWSAPNGAPAGNKMIEPSSFPIQPPVADVA